MSTATGAPSGVLLVNLGSPAAPTAAALRAYLREFLSDPLVVDWPRWLWLPVLHGIILRSRPARSAALYQRVWTDAGSPLLAIGRRQAALLEARLGPDWRVVPAMRYGAPSLAHGLGALMDAGCGRIVVLPLFPQYSRTTTGSVVAALPDLVAALPAAPEVEVVRPYPTDPGYVGALARRIGEDLQAHPADHLVLSFHGVPERLVAGGDLYRQHCEATAVALAEALGRPAGEWSLVFQSRFGPERWLQPYADRHVPALAARFPRVSVACPGFPADCLETLDEIGHVLAERFRAAGGESLRLVPGLNDHPAWIDAMAALVQREADPE